MIFGYEGYEWGDIYNTFRFWAWAQTGLPVSTCYYISLDLCVLACQWYSPPLKSWSTWFPVEPRLMHTEKGPVKRLWINCKWYLQRRRPYVSLHVTNWWVTIRLPVFLHWWEGFLSQSVQWPCEVGGEVPYPPSSGPAYRISIRLSTLANTTLSPMPSVSFFINSISLHWTTIHSGTWAGNLSNP